MNGLQRIRNRLGADRIAALLFLVLVVLYGWDAAGFKAALQADVVGPTFFPRILTGLGVVLGLALLAQGGPRGEGQAGGAGSDVTALVPALLLLGYVLVLEWLGFPFATVLFLAAMFRYLGHPTWLGTAGWSVAITAVVFALFHYALNLRLPLGLLAGFK